MCARLSSFVAVILASGAGLARAQTLDIVDTEPGTYIDITGTGTPLALAGDQSTRITTTIGNALFPAGDVVVANNGGLGFGNPPSDLLAPLNDPLPSQTAFGGGQSLLGFWDDIGNTVAIYWKDLPDRLVVEWPAKHFEGSDDSITFEFQIFNGVSGNGTYAQMLYADVEQPRASGGESATIGYQDLGPRANAVQWSFDTAGAVSNGTVLSLVVVPEPATLVLLMLGVGTGRGGRERNRQPTSA